MEKSKKRKMIAAAVVVMMLLGGALYSFSPEIRVKRFVRKYHKELEQAYEAGNIPEITGGKPNQHHLWYGEHTMVQFDILPWGNGYRGCYYSPDDVPLPFQNINVPLKENGRNRWIWTDGGDNRGMTSKIIDKWYYFEAAF